MSHPPAGAAAAAPHDPQEPATSRAEARTEARSAAHPEAPAVAAHPGDAAPAALLEEDTPPAPRSHYATSRSDLTMRNAGWALALTFAVVAVIAVLFFGVGRAPDREVPETSRVNVADSAQRAASSSSFPLAVPSLGDSWTARDARFTADGAGGERWTVRYTSPSGRLVTLVQTAEVTPGIISEAVPGAREEQAVQVAGRTCDVYAGAAEDGKAGGGSGGDPQRAVVCSDGGPALVVTGRTTVAELGTLATAAGESVGS